MKRNHRLLIPVLALCLLLAACGGGSQPQAAAWPEPAATADRAAATPEPTPEPPFSMVWVSDTQTMVAYPSMYEGFTAMCDWIVENAEARNFKLYLHSGDMVDNGLNREQ